MAIHGPVHSTVGLETHGFSNLGDEHWNLGTPALYEHAILNGEGDLAADGPLVVLTGHHTGRSANDKFIVRDRVTEDTVNWGKVNVTMDPGHFQTLKRRMLAYYQGRDAYVQDLYGGADPDFRVKVRVVTEQAWHNLFASHLLIVPPKDDRHDFAPDFTIIQAPGFLADPEIDGSRSQTVITMDFTERVVLIAGTSYAGEIKKSVFSILNFLLPPRDVLPMHCSVNVGEAGDSAVFFGLSGTGKTTLSADPHRMLIGDDEHGWSENGLFNFEGGCYAKVIRLSAEAEPEIYATTQRFGTVLENVVMDPDTGRLNLDDNRYTENTRAAYPLDFIPNASPTGHAGHPGNVVMLTADAFGVLPPISKLNAEQAMYHFLSGYTAKVAGTEKGLGNEPQATFSTCFGAPFMPRHPSVYAQMLADKINKHGSDCWLVNTGWSGGTYGVGERMSIRHTRALLNAALDGSLAKSSFRQDDNFGVLVPESCPDVPDDVLNPRSTWSDKGAYDDQARDLCGRFHKNFEIFNDYVEQPVREAGPRQAA
ncbi:MAG: phosphoenolpyruvate carboxykinase (ATP) [Rhodospirillaceae bacterium]|nr:phosphoenolpyruvate carboxykinase (ATP) [Rhodospirillaceae bacterium]